MCKFDLTNETYPDMPSMPSVHPYIHTHKIPGDENMAVHILAA